MMNEISRLHLTKFPLVIFVTTLILSCQSGEKTEKWKTANIQGVQLHYTIEGKGDNAACKCAFG